MALKFFSHIQSVLGSTFIIHKINNKMFLNILLFTIAFTYAQENNSITETPYAYTSIPTLPPTTTDKSTSTTFEPPTTVLVTETKVNVSSTTESAKVGCTCGIFLSGQFKKSSKEPPKGNPALINEHPEVYPCNNHGNKVCTNKCLEVIVKHLPNSASILCGSIDRDCERERAYLFIKNCKDEWINTNLSAGREYCCKDGLSYKCASN